MWIGYSAKLNLQYSDNTSYNDYARVLPKVNFLI